MLRANPPPLPGAGNMSRSTSKAQLRKACQVLLRASSIPSIKHWQTAVLQRGARRHTAHILMLRLIM